MKTISTMKVDTAPTCGEDCWKLATYDQMAQLVNGWPGGANANWALWLDQQTKEAIYQLKAVNAKTMMADLSEVMGGRRSPIAGLVRLIPLERVNAILAVSPQVSRLSRTCGTSRP